MQFLMLNSDIKPLTSFPRNLQWDHFTSVSWGNCNWLSTRYNDSTVNTTMSSHSSSVVWTIQNIKQSHVYQINRLKACNMVAQIRIKAKLQTDKQWFFSVLVHHRPRHKLQLLLSFVNLPAMSLRAPLSTVDCPLKSNYFSDYLAEDQPHGVSSGPFQPSRACPFSLC